MYTEANKTIFTEKCRTKTNEEKFAKYRQNKKDNKDKNKSDP